MNEFPPFLFDFGGFIRRPGGNRELLQKVLVRVFRFFELILQPWDFAAGALLVKEAGGQFTMPFGDGKVRFDGPQGVLAVNKVCAEKALAVLTAAH